MYLPGGGCTCLEGGVPAWKGGTCLEGGYLAGGGVPAWRGVYLHGGGYLPGGGCTCLGGVPAWRGVYLPGGGYLPEGGCLVRYSPPVNRMTDACENITLVKTSFRPVKIIGN